ncbi:MAG: phytanoyl-CoA dioxygenase family protein [Planctomycetes bacterium]|nr:phytanoyl-CoA dioxygenase family protein [Planctomycetota bacterium]
MVQRPTEIQQKQWLEEGYLVIEDAIAGEDLRRLQRAFDTWAEKCKADWLESVEAGQASPTFYDIPNVLERDEVFIDLVDHSSFYGLLAEFMVNDMIFIGPQARTVPAWPVSYSGWHQDVPFSNPLHIKVQVYVNDVDRDGAFAFIPGSHRRGTGPYPAVQRLQSMPGHRVLPGRAGTAILFNTYGYHTAMDNPRGQPRKSIILIYEKRTPGRLDPKAFAAIAHRCRTPERRRLFGLEDPTCP